MDHMFAEPQQSRFQEDRERNLAPLQPSVPPGFGHKPYERVEHRGRERQSRWDVQDRSGLDRKRSLSPPTKPSLRRVDQTQLLQAIDSTQEGRDHQGAAKHTKTDASGFHLYDHLKTTIADAKAAKNRQKVHLGRVTEDCKRQIQATKEPFDLFAQAVRDVQTASVKAEGTLYEAYLVVQQQNLKITAAVESAKKAKEHLSTCQEEFNKIKGSAETVVEKAFDTLQDGFTRHSMLAQGQLDKLRKSEQE